MERIFDCEGLVLAIREVGRAYKSPLPETIEKLGFCRVCLGANVPGQMAYPKYGWRCGSWCDGLLPPFKICERFWLDRQRLECLVKSVRPDGTDRRWATNS